MSQAETLLNLVFDTELNSMLGTLSLSNLTRGFLRSMSERIAPLRTESMMLPSSFSKIHSTDTFQTNLPERIHKDSGSRALEPTIMVYKSLTSYVESFLCY